MPTSRKVGFRRFSRWPSLLCIHPSNVSRRSPLPGSLLKPLVLENVLGVGREGVAAATGSSARLRSTSFAGEAPARSLGWWITHRTLTSRVRGSASELACWHNNVLRVATYRVADKGVSRWPKGLTANRNQQTTLIS